MTRYAYWLMTLLMLLVTSPTPAGTVTYIHTDAQGTPVMESDAQGHITARFEYTPYGVVVTSMGAAPDGVGYTGHVNDPESGLVYMQARYYDADAGRFLSVDPVTSYEKPLTHFNRYVYVLNNPCRFIDPDGRTYKVKGDPDAVAQFNRQVKRLEKTPTGAALVKFVRESRQNAVITVERKGQDITKSNDEASSLAGKPTDATVHFNVDLKASGPDTSGSRKVDPFVNAGHEFGHLEAIFKGTQNFDVGDGKPGTTPPSEKNNLEIENAIRGENNIPLRTSYN